MGNCAWNSEERLVYADNASKGDLFQCPFCSNPVVLVEGHDKTRNGATSFYTTHFRHLDEYKSYCPSDNFVTNQKGEGQLHKKAKNQVIAIANQSLGMYFPKDGFACKPELPAPGRRPDIALCDKHGRSFLNKEVQCSPISISEIDRRCSIDRANKVGNTIWIFSKEIKTLPLERIAMDRSSTGTSQSCEEYVTHERTEHWINPDNGFPYNRRVKTKWDVLLEQRTKEETAGLVTTDSEAILIESSYRDFEKAQKAIQYIPLGIPGKNSVDEKSLTQRIFPASEKNDLFDTKTSNVPIELIESKGIKLPCKIVNGLGIAMEFDANKKKVKVVSAGDSKHSGQWMSADKVYISAKDFESVIGLSKKNRSKESRSQQEQQEQTALQLSKFKLELVGISDEYRIAPDIDWNKGYKYDIADVLIRNDGSEHDLNLKPKPIPNSNTGVTEIKEGDGFVLLRPIPLGVTVDNGINQGSPNRIIENNGVNDDLNPKIVGDQHQSVKPLPELSIYRLGDKVKYKHPVTGWVDAIFKGFHTPELAPKGSKWSFMEISIDGKLHKAYSLNQIKLA